MEVGGTFICVWLDNARRQSAIQSARRHSVKTSPKMFKKMKFCLLFGLIGLEFIADLFFSHKVPPFEEPAHSIKQDIEPYNI